MHFLDVRIVVRLSFISHLWLDSRIAEYNLKIQERNTIPPTTDLSSVGLVLVAEVSAEVTDRQPNTG